MSEAYVPYVALVNEDGHVPIKDALLKIVQSGTAPTKKFRLGEYSGFNAFLQTLQEGRKQIDGVVLYSCKDNMCERYFHVFLQKLVTFGIRRLVIVADGAGFYTEDDAYADAEVQTTLESLGFPMNQFAYISGTVEYYLRDGDEYAPQMRELVKDINTVIVAPAEQAAGFRMTIDEVYAMKSGGMITVGTVAQGTLHVGDEVEALGYGRQKKLQVNGLEMYRKLLDWVEEGDNAGVLFKNAERGDLERGMMLTTPGKIQMADTVHAIVYVPTKDEDPRANHSPLLPKSRPTVHMGSAQLTSLLLFDNEQHEVCMPGDFERVEIRLIQEMPYVSGSRIELFDFNGKFLAVGSIL